MSRGYTKEQRAKLGLCTECGKEVEGDLRRRASNIKKKMCRVCLKKNSTKAAEYRKIRHEAGLCERCGKNPNKPNRKHCESCIKGLSNRARGLRQRMFFDRRARSSSGPTYSIETVKNLWSLWKKQRGLCALTGARLNRNNAELDHIVPVSKGGTHEKKNLRWLLGDVNQAKRALTDEQFLLLCRSVVDFADRRQNVL